MKLFLALIFCATLLLGGITLAQSQPDQKSLSTVASKAEYIHVNDYDPKRDAAADINNAVAAAAQSHRRVLVEIGGKWCIWCTYLDKFFDQNVALRKFRDENFVTVKVNFSAENKNETTIAHYGKVEGYPHIFVLDAEGKLLHSQDTSKLEEGRGYSTQAIANFLEKWKPKS